MAGVKFDITGNANGFVKAAKQAEGAVKDMGKSVANESKALDDMFKKLAGGMATMAAGLSASALTKKIFDIRSEFQQLEVAFSTMLKSKEKANKLMKDATEFAATTPFDLKGVAAGIKQNLAYGASVDTVIDEMRMLGDVAAGIGAPLNDLVYLYGTLRTSGRVATIDIRQFAGRGIPIYEELAKVLGVAKNEVAGLASAGKITFNDIEKAFQNMTSAGGMFNNLMANQSKTLQGQYSNLVDNIEMMFNEIGQKTQGVMADGISLAGKLVENYESVGRALSVLVATYGTYKAAVLAVAAAQKVQVAAETIKHFLELTKVMKTAAAAQAAFNGAALANPYILAATALTALVAGVVAFTKHKKAEVEAQKAASREVAAEVNEVNTLAAKLKNANIAESERVKALERLKEIAPSVVEGINAESTSLDALTKNLEEYNSLKQLEITLKASGAYFDFTESIKSLDDAKVEMQDKKAEIENLWLDLSAKITQAINSGDIKGDLKKYLEEFLYDPNVEVQEKVLKVTKKYSELAAKARKGGAYGKATYGGDADLLGDIVERGTNKKVADFVSTTEELSEAENKYTSAVDSLRKRIHDSVALVYDDAEKAAEAEQMLLVALGLEKAKSTGGGTKEDEKALTEKQKEEAYKRQQAEIKASENLAKMKRDLNAKVAKADIDSMEEGYVKTMATLKYNLQQEQNAIEDQKKALLKSKKDDALKSWLAEDPEGRKEYQFVYTPELSSEEAAIFEAMGEQAQKEFNKGRLKAIEQYSVESALTMRQYEVDAMPDGTDKNIAQRQLDNDREIHNLEMQRAAYIEAAKAAHILAEEKKAAADASYQKKEFDATSANASFDKIVADTQAKQDKETIKQNYDEMLGEFKSYQQRRSEIEEQYAKSKSNFYKRDENGKLTTELKEGVTQENLDEHARAKNEALAAVDEEFAMRSEQYQGWLEYIGTLSLQQLRSALTEAEAVLAEAEKNGSSQEVAEARAKVNTLQKQIPKKEVAASPQKRTIDEWKDLKDALEDCVGAFDEIGGAIGGVAGEVISSTGAIMASSLSMVNGIMTLVETFSSGAIATAQGAAKAIKVVETASVILTVISLAFQIVMKIIDAVKGLMDSDNQAEIDRLTGANKELDASYQKLEKDIKKAYSVDASDLINQQNELLEQKKKNLELMIAEEEAKKDSDPKQIAQWKEQINSINETIEENADKAQEAIIGISFDDFRNKFIDALMDMEEGVDGFSEDIEDSIREAMYNALLSNDEFERELNRFYNDLTKAVQRNDTAEIQRLKKAIYSLYDEQEAEARKIDELIGYESSSDRSASESGIAQASQSSVDELNGRMTNIQSHTFSINQQLSSVVNLTSQILARVTNIDSNTARLSYIETSVANISDYVSDILTRGIIVK